MKTQILLLLGLTILICGAPSAKVSVYSRVCENPAFFNEKPKPCEEYCSLVEDHWCPVDDHHQPSCTKEAEEEYKEKRDKALQACTTALQELDAQKNSEDRNTTQDNNVEPKEPSPGPTPIPSPTDIVHPIVLENRQNITVPPSWFLNPFCCHCDTENATFPWIQLSILLVLLVLSRLIASFLWEKLYLGPRRKAQQKRKKQELELIITKAVRIALDTQRNPDLEVTLAKAITFALGKQSNIDMENVISNAVRVALESSSKKNS